MTEPATDELIAEIKAGLEGVSPGPYEVDTERQSDAPYKHDEYALFNGAGQRICGTENSDTSFGLLETEYDEDGAHVWNEPARKLMAHIARCSPDNIAAILARLEAAEQHVAALTHTIEQLHGPLSVAALKARAETAEAENKRLAANRDKLERALCWYGENARLCRLIHSEGDLGRNNLSADGGERARAALDGK